MAPRCCPPPPPSSSQSHYSSSNLKRFLIFVSLVSIPFLLFVITVMKHLTQTALPAVKTHHAMLHQVVNNNNNNKNNKKAAAELPAWYDIIAKGINDEKIKVGLVNFEGELYEQQNASLNSSSHVETVPVSFNHVYKKLKWEDFYPEWIDEEGKWGPPKCPEMPMAASDIYQDLNVVVARVPCEQGIIDNHNINMDVFRLQVNLVVANLAVESGWVTSMEGDHRKVYVVFVGPCGPMEEIFRCDDLLAHKDGYWVYNPDLRSLKQKTLMPVGSCQIAPGYAETGKEKWRPWSGSVTHKTSNPANQNSVTTIRTPRYAYVTILHSSEAYVCGAIALAQSIIQTNKNILKIRDLVLLADDSISRESITALKAAGWNKIKRIQRISNPSAEKGAYNEWNYSKLRIWQLTMYEKIVFIDSDLLVLKSIDNLFVYPQLSAAPNEKTLFNSGLMVVEPSQCTFKNMMKRVSMVQSYNGGDQGFLNEIFGWWHRMPSKLNHLKTFGLRGVDDQKHEVPGEELLYAIHYLGLKPWMCYRDYDCNWDMRDHHIFASDSAHWRWWQVYDAMPEELKGYCGITAKMNERIVKRRREARNANFSDGHWKIEIKDPRKKHYYVG